MPDWRQMIRNRFYLLPTLSKARMNQAHKVPTVMELSFKKGRQINDKPISKIQRTKIFGW